MSNLTEITPTKEAISIMVQPLNFTTGSLPPIISLGPSVVIPQPLFIVLLLIYILVIFLASSGSILVITVVLLANHLRTHSNCYLVNLAVSDLLLVLVACPATLAQVSSSHWPLPSIPALCQLATFLPLLFSFASTFSICLIALDRHQLIVHTKNPQHKTAITITSIISVWIFAFICAAPILPNTRLEIHHLSPRFYSLLGIKERVYCMEDWGYQEGRLCYSLGILGIQFMLPSMILIMAHASIYRKLNASSFWGRHRTTLLVKVETEMQQQTGQTVSERSAEPCLNPKRGHRTIYLLLCVVIVFMCSWLPLNVLNVLLDLGLYSYLFRWEVQRRT